MPDWFLWWVEDSIKSGMFWVYLTSFIIFCGFVWKKWIITIPAVYNFISSVITIAWGFFCLAIGLALTIYIIASLLI